MNTKAITLTLVGSSLIGAASLFGADKLKVGFVYNTPIGDTGWIYQHDLARKELEAKMGGKVSTQFVESIPASDAERVIRQFANGGCNVIFATTFEYMNPTLKVATSYPNVKFFHNTGYKTANNVSVYNGRFYEVRYLTGIIAGKMTKKNVIGYVAAFPIPEVIQGINAFTQGVRSVNPKAEVRVVWVNSWYDPGKEREAALALLAQGVDILSNHTNSTSVMQTAQEKGVKAFCWQSNMIKYGKDAQLTGTVLNWGGYYVKVINDIMAGKFKSSNVWGGMKDGMVSLAPMSKAVPADVQKLVQKKEAEIKSGKFHPFAGPVTDKDGKVRVPAGRKMSDEELNIMDYYVQGVASDYPKK